MENVITVNVTMHLFCLYVWKLPQEEVCHVKIPTDLLSIKTVRAEYQLLFFYAFADLKHTQHLQETYYYLK